MKSREYLEMIRTSAGLERAILERIEVHSTKAVFYLVTDKSYDDADLTHAKNISAQFVPHGYTADARVRKCVPSEDGVRSAIIAALVKLFPTVAAYALPDDIKVEVGKAGGRYSVGVSPQAKTSEDMLDKINEQVGRAFCGSWVGAFYLVEREFADNRPVRRERTTEYVAEPRSFEIAKYKSIDGAKCTEAVYIGDLDREMQNITVCGNVVDVEERMTKPKPDPKTGQLKEGKPYFSFTISDGTGILRTVYFSRKATLEKVRAIKAGDSVCLTGDYEVYRDSLSFSVSKVDLGQMPDGFTPEKRASLPVPEEYATVFPEPTGDYVQSDMFGGKPLPEPFLQTDFVVFDLETTGTHTRPDDMDRIIEIGAVKIRNGMIVEKFSSFVACPVKLPEEIIELTGITDDMLVGAPEVSAVLADFYKFADGCALVGHNVQFDASFIRHYGEKAGFMFEHRTYDTLALSRQTIRLNHYKLNQVAEYFGFTFNHHRAYDDAFVTAKIFIELVRLKGSFA